MKEEDPASKHQEGQEEYEKLALKTQPKGKISQTRTPWASKT
jgi:hypothetical protein